VADDELEEEFEDELPDELDDDVDDEDAVEEEAAELDVLSAESPPPPHAARAAAAPRVPDVAKNARRSISMPDRLRRPAPSGTSRPLREA
jgi:hypothetical protein